VIAIGGFAASGTPYEACYIGGIAGAEISTANAASVYIDTTTGQLGTALVGANGNKSTAPVRRGAQRQAMFDRKVEKLQTRIAQQEKQIEILSTQLKEQAAQIQKVSAQLETSRPAPRVVTNNQ